MIEDLSVVRCESSSVLMREMCSLTHCLPNVAAISNAQLEECVTEAGLAWGNLAVFIADTPLMVGISL